LLQETVIGVRAPAAGVSTTLKHVVGKIYRAQGGIIGHTATGFTVEYPLKVTVASCGSRSNPLPSPACGMNERRLFSVCARNVFA